MARSRQTARSDDWQDHLQPRAPERRRADRHAAVVRHDDLLDERQAKTGAVLLGREERLEDAVASASRNAGVPGSPLVRAAASAKTSQPSNE